MFWLWAISWSLKSSNWIKIQLARNKVLKLWPEALLAVFHLATFTGDPCERHYDGLVRIAQHLATTRRSTEGYVIKFMGGPLVAVSRRQRNVTKSSCEAEYCTLACIKAENDDIRRGQYKLSSAIDMILDAKTMSSLNSYIDIMTADNEWNPNEAGYLKWSTQLDLPTMWSTN